MQKSDLKTLSERYNTFFVDQFGVLLDGRKAYAGATDALSWLKAQGKQIVILSNSGRPGAFNADRLVSLGFSPASFDQFVTSGDVAYALLSSGELPLDIGPGGRCLTVSKGNDANLAERLGLQSTVSAGDADLVVISGSEADTLGMDHYRQLLQPAAERGVVCVCTNPDIHMLTGDEMVPGAGSIADLYEEMGGPVHRIGKPFIDIYKHAYRIAGEPEKHSVVAVGDSLDHDIAGANGFGIDSILMRTGVLADFSLAQLDARVAASGARPTHLLQQFTI